MGEKSVLLQTRYCEHSHWRQGPATRAALGTVPPVLSAAVKSRSQWPGFSPAAEQSPLINLLSLRYLQFMCSLHVQRGLRDDAFFAQKNGGRRGYVDSKGGGKPCGTVSDARQGGFSAHRTRHPLCVCASQNCSFDVSDCSLQNRSGPPAPRRARGVFPATYWGRHRLPLLPDKHTIFCILWMEFILKKQ